MNMLLRFSCRVELHAALKRLGIFVDEKIMSSLFAALDADGNGTVNVPAV